MRLSLLLGGSLLFVLGGLFIIPRDWRLGLGGVGFFGGCAAMFAFQLWELVRGERDARVLQLPGGVPLFESRARRAFVLAIGLEVGAATMLFGSRGNALMWWLGMAIGVASAAALLRLALVRGPARLMFSPEGIHFLGGEAPCLLHFDNLGRLGCGERAGNPVLLFEPITLAALVLTVPEGQREAAARRFAQSIGFVGAPLVIFPARLGLEAPSLMKTIERWVREPATRSELQVRAG